MVGNIIEWSVRNVFLVLLGTFFVVAWGECGCRRGRKAGDLYSAIVLPEPPNSAGKSANLARPSFMGSTVSE